MPVTVIANRLWPLPALAAWALGWIVFAAARASGGGTYGLVAAMVLASMAAAGLSLLAATPWRRVFVAAGFPLSLAASGAVALPAWVWLVLLALLLAIYPVNAWRDAPVFPTPAGALDGLALRLPLAGGARLLDAGCGLGDGLRALRRAYPQAQLNGLEWVGPLAAAAALRCRDARVRRGDIWSADWSAYDLVYLFQRPESMARAWSKACDQMPAGGWLASLEFPVPGRTADGRYACPDGRPVWLYRCPGARATGRGGAAGVA
jgi:hypothetical protein